MFRYNHAIKELTGGQKESIHLKIPKHSGLKIPQLFPLPVISESGKCVSKRLLYSRMPEGNQISSWKWSLLGEGNNSSWSKHQVGIQKVRLRLARTVWTVVLYARSSWAMTFMMWACPNYYCCLLALSSSLLVEKKKASKQIRKAPGFLHGVWLHWTQF